MVASETQQTDRAETSAPSSEPLIPHEQIASFAYALSEQRGYPEGSSEEDWFRAEQELLTAVASLSPAS